MTQISKEMKISKGKVHYLLKEWKVQVGSLNFNEILDFSRTVKGSNITIEQCAQGFRMINILKTLGIEIRNFDDMEEREEEDEYINENKKIYNNDFNGLSSFLETIYKNCKKLEISPSIIPLWIKDLLEFYSTIDIENLEKDTNDKIQTSSIKDEEKNLDDFQTVIINKKNIDKYDNISTLFYFIIIVIVIIIRLNT